MPSPGGVAPPGDAVTPSCPAWLAMAAPASCPPTRNCPPVSTSTIRIAEARATRKKGVRSRSIAALLGQGDGTGGGRGTRDGDTAAVTVDGHGYVIAGLDVGGDRLLTARRPGDQPDRVGRVQLDPTRTPAALRDR